MKIAIIGLALVALTANSGCVIYEDESGGNVEGNTKGPGQQPYNSENVSCSSNDDCADGEACEAGVCRMERCAETYESLAPMGQNHYFGIDGEVTVISDGTWVDGFEAADGEYMNSWDLDAQGEKVVDVAGGALTAEKPHTIAVALEFSDKVQLKGPGGVSELYIGIWPKALAVGDIDADGLDELVAFAEDGAISVCDVDEKKCTGATLPGASGKDVAVADVDGDGFAEPIFLFDLDGKSEVVVWNLDAEITGQEETIGWEFSFPIRAFASGDLDGDGVAEVVTLEDGGWWGWANDKVHVFSPAAEAITSSDTVNGHTIDVAIGDRNSDDIAEVAILRDDQKFELFKSNEGALQSLGSFAITVGEKATRISIVDWNGDSATGKLVAGPELIAGNAVPTAVLMFPPYPRNVAKGALNANITLGNTETTSESHSDTLSLSVGLTVSFGAETPIFKAKVGGYLGKDFSYTNRVTKKVTVGARYWVLAAPELHGFDYAPVVMSCGCYHKYSYVTDDPTDRIGGSGQTLDLYMPVGGQTTLWSSKRYNAMAEAAGDLPIIDVPITIGDVASYPSAIQTLDGQPVPEEDILFPNTPTYQASDVGFVSFWLVNGEDESNEVAEKTTIGVNGSIGAGGVSVDSSINVGVAQGYSITAGKDVIFAGGIPPIPDDPETPEDEFKVHGYSFRPHVYRQHYTNSAGEDAAYYVMHYSVGQ